MHVKRRYSPKWKPFDITLLASFNGQDELYSNVSKVLYPRLQANEGVQRLGRGKRTAWIPSRNRIGSHVDVKDRNCEFVDPRFEWAFYEWWVNGKKSERLYGPEKARKRRWFPTWKRKKNRVHQRVVGGGGEKESERREQTDFAIVYFSGNYTLPWKEPKLFSLRIYFCRECVLKRRVLPSRGSQVKWRRCSKMWHFLRWALIKNRTPLWFFFIFRLRIVQFQIENHHKGKWFIPVHFDTCNCCIFKKIMKWFLKKGVTKGRG